MKSHFVWLLRAAALAHALMLVACGGGGGYAAPSAPTKLLSLSGVVTDAPIPGAVVTVRIGGQVFTTVAASDGRYRLAITVPAEAGGSLVVIEARGPAGSSNSRVALLSLANSFDSLLAAAGSDRVVDASEVPAVNVTHLSTANAAMVIELNHGVPITEAALHLAEDQIDPRGVLEIAAAIKLIIDSPESFKLPEGTNDTLEFARNQVAREQFIEAARQNNPDDFEQAQEATVIDPAVSSPPQASNMPNSLIYVAPLADQKSFIFTDQAHILNFSSNGTGSYIGRAGKLTTHWSVRGTTIVNTFDTPLSLPRESDFTVYDTEHQGLYDCQHDSSYQSFEITRLSARSARILRRGNDHQTCHPVSGGEPFERDIAKSDPLFVILVDDDNTLPAPDLGTARDFALYTLDLGQEQKFLVPIAAELMSFNPAGSGFSRFFAGNFTWQKSPDGKRLIVNFANGLVSTYRVLRNIDRQASVVLFMVAKPDGQVHADINLGFAGAAIEPLTPDLVPGAYYQFGVGEENKDKDPYNLLNGFSLEFYAGGNGQQVTPYYQYDGNGEMLRDENGNPVVSEDRTKPGQFRWKSTASSIINIRTYSNARNVSGSRYNICMEGDADCSVWDRRENFLVNFAEGSDSSDDRAYVIERRQTTPYVSEGLHEDTATTYLLRYYDIRPLPAASR